MFLCQSDDNNHEDPMLMAMIMITMIIIITIVQMSLSDDNDVHDNHDDHDLSPCSEFCKRPETCCDRGDEEQPRRLPSLSVKRLRRHVGPGGVRKLLPKNAGDPCLGRPGA